LKRALDLGVSSLALVVLSPLLLLIAILIKLDSEGPVLYRAPRVGLGGQLFSMYKFRTMVVDADRGPSSTPDDDPRITRVGRVLRRYKLDELPQLFNVFGGTMSLVGPRPQVKWTVDLYSDEERLALTVPPGITDWASLRFPNEGEILRGAADPDQAYFEKIHPEKMRLAVAYVRNRSLTTDLAILWKTFVAILRF
jgi:lipopolysaccharide/colanic/teichoic acid biosynthesis glycosyltransferase